MTGRSEPHGELKESESRQRTASQGPSGRNKLKVVSAVGEADGGQITRLLCTLERGVDLTPMQRKITGGFG